MIKVSDDPSGKTLLCRLINPVNQQVVLDMDGFKDREEIAAFIADIHVGITDVVIPVSDILEKINEEKK